MDYITPKEAAVQWGISERRVEAHCANGRIDSAERLGDKMWVILKSVLKPIDGRTKAAKALKSYGYEQCRTANRR